MYPSKKISSQGVVKYCAFYRSFNLDVKIINGPENVDLH